MSPTTLFSIASTLVMPSWILLIVAPNHTLTRVLVKSGVVSAVLSLLYTISLALGSSAFSNGGGFDSLDAVRILFTNDWALLAGWIHYLAFDLLIGVHVGEKMLNRNKVLRGLCLFAIFMFGPFGWILSQIINPKNK